MRRILFFYIAIFTLIIFSLLGCKKSNSADLVVAVRSGITAQVQEAIDSGSEVDVMLSLIHI